MLRLIDDNLWFSLVVGVSALAFCSAIVFVIVKLTLWAVTGPDMVPHWHDDLQHHTHPSVLEE